MADSKQKYQQTTLTHYAHHKTVNGWITTPTQEDEIKDALIFAQQTNKKVCILGAQNSFSDLFLGENQLHISMLKMNKILSCNFESKEITAQAGTRIWQIHQQIIPAGYYLPGLSSSYTDTIGGMISSNSFGKDSWLHGNCGNNVIQIKIITASGESILLQRHSELFNAVIAGLGLIGIITEITFQLKKMPSFFLCAKNHPLQIQQLDSWNIPADFKYIWVDMSGKKNPPAVVKTATFDTSLKYYPSKIPVASKNIFGLPPQYFWKLLRCFWNTSTYPYANKLIYFSQLNKLNQERPINWINYYYPFHKLPSNYHIFKNNSFFELQHLFPFSNFQSAFHQLYELMKKYKIFPIAPSIRWHREDEYYLSFSGNGFSILCAFEAALLKTNFGKKFLEQYLDIVNQNYGKTYLTKYPYLDINTLKKQYPDFELWLTLKKKIDPQFLFLSDRAATFLNY